MVTAAADVPAPVQAFLDGISVWDALTFIIVVGAAVLFVWRKGWRTVIAMARGLIHTSQILEAVQGLPAFQAEMRKKVDQIHHEVHFNNGSSVKDATKRIEEGVAGLYGELDAVKQSVETLVASDQKQWDAIERTAGKDPDPHDET